MNYPYRADVDGLRAVAVAAVLLFHLGFDWADGGFVGVDVFFVISGYLITGMVLAAKFTFGQFYLRRVARLLPAMIAVVVATMLAGFLLFDAFAFKQIGFAAIQSLIATSNIYFWETIGYFDDAARTQPLLHTWSLSVEWQFYLVWPFVLRAAFLQYGVGGAAAACGVALLGGFALEQAWMTFDRSGAFFLSPPRIFEFAAGGCCALAGPFMRRSFRELAGAVGLVLIAIAIFAKPQGVDFPGLWVLLPVIGTVSLLSAPGSLANRVLAVRPLVAVGLLSYSIYLVHWPIITFARYVLYRPLVLDEQLALGALTIALAVALYFAVEKPFRLRGVTTSLAASLRVAACGAGVALGVYAGAGAVAREGMPSRVEGSYSLSFFGHVPCGTDGNVASLSMMTCTFGSPGKPRILLIGDSHSRQFAWGLSQSWMAQSYEFFSVFWGSCLPIPGFVGTDPDCRRMADETNRALRDTDYELVIFSARWKGYRPVSTDDIRELVKISKSKVVVIGPTPFPEYKRPCDRPLFVTLSSCEFIAAPESDMELSRDITKAARDAGANPVDLFEAGCVQSLCPFYHEGSAMYADTNHLSKTGSAYYVSSIQSVLNNSLR